MRDMNERPVCHRAEDLVTYLYGEAGEADALDFRSHLQACNACQSEFADFNQVHESIVSWRDEALGATFNSAVAAAPAPESAVRAQPSRRLPAFAALREFFQVSPLWLRAVTAFAAMLLCVLAVLTVVRRNERPISVANANPDLKYTQDDLNQAVQKAVDATLAQTNRSNASAAKQTPKSEGEKSDVRVAVNRTQPKKRLKGLTLAERQQLAADLRLVPGTDDEELPFGISEQPNQ